MRRMGEEEAALEKIERALAIDARSIGAWIEKARVWSDRGGRLKGEITVENFLDAAECYRHGVEFAQHAVELFSASLDAYLALGAAQRADRNWAEARKCFGTAQAKDSNSSSPFLELGRLLLDEKRFGLLPVSRTPR